MDMNLTPLISFSLFLAYMFFPSSTYFNGQGRLYCFRLLAKLTRVNNFQHEFLFQFVFD